MCFYFALSMYLVLLRNLDALPLKDAVDFEHKCYVVKLFGLEGVTLSKMACIPCKSFQIIAFGGEHLHTQNLFMHLYS